MALRPENIVKRIRVALEQGELFQTSLNEISLLIVVSVSSKTLAEAMGFKKSSGCRALMTNTSQNWSILRTGSAPAGLIGEVWDV